MKTLNNFNNFKIATALGNKTRLSIIKELQKNNNGLSLINLENIFSKAKTTLFFHLNKLENAKIIQRNKRQGIEVFYTLNNKALDFFKLFLEKEF